MLYFVAFNASGLSCGFPRITSSVKTPKRYSQAPCENRCRGNTETGRVEVISEFVYTPFAFELVLSSSKERDRGQITHFADFTYDDKKDVELSLISGEVASYLPGDYRSRYQVIAQGEKNLGRELKDEDHHCLIDKLNK